MPLFDTFSHKSTQVTVWKLEESTLQILSRLNITDSDNEQLQSFKLEKRKQEWLASRLLLQEMLGFYPHIIYDANGKPALLNDKRHISISHTYEFVAVSLSDNNTAIDIERCTDRVLKVYNRFVHKDEATYIKQDDTKYLTTLWCAKEALYKYHNIEGVIFKEQFLVHPFAIDHSKELHCEFFNDGQVHKSDLQLIQNEHFTLVYC